MLAYKWLLDEGRSAITGFRWPLPQGGRSGDWVDVDGELVLCRNGVHACRVGQLAHWLGPQLWLVELGGLVMDVGGMLVSSRGRLVDAVGAWSGGAKADFASACSVRSQQLARVWQYAGEVEDVVGFAQNGDAAGAGYVTAVLKGREAAGGAASGVQFDAGFLAERAWQAQWLAERLGLADDAPRPGWGT